MVLGSHWRMKPLVLTKAGISKGPQKVAFHHAPGATVLSNRSGIFLWQPGTRSGDWQDAIDMTTAVQCSHNICVTIGLPRAAPSATAMYDQAVHALMDVFHALYSIDASFLIYVFPTKAQNNPQA